MRLDARNLPAKTMLDADICIVGAGPAGLTLAREFAGSKTTVLIFESGGLNLDERSQELNVGAVIGGPYVGLRQSRFRQVGGTAHLWNTDVGDKRGAKYVPLDPWDFDALADSVHTEWPIQFSELEHFYQRAQIVCGLGPFTYEGQDWSDAQHPLLPLSVDQLRTKVYQCGVGQAFTNLYPKEIIESENIQLCHHATVRRLRMRTAGKHASEASVATLSGNEFHARAGIFVLAAGAIENARLLLVSGERGAESPGNKFGWVGRCFTEHPRDRSLTLIPRSPNLFDETTFYDLHSALDGTVVCGRIALDGSMIRTNGVPNASITLLPRPRNSPMRLPSVVAKITSYLPRFIGTEPTIGYGWSRKRNRRQKFDAFELLINLEQQPNPENRIVLAQKCDLLGVPRVNLIWRWNDAEQANLERLRVVIASMLEASEIGRIEVKAGCHPDPNAHHHAGTTRMQANPRWGVVDADARVHGTENLYVTGASVLCRAGFANPTLTIVAFALRLADHLKQRI